MLMEFLAKQKQKANVKHFQKYHYEEVDIVKNMVVELDKLVNERVPGIESRTRILDKIFALVPQLIRLGITLERYNVSSMVMPKINAFIRKEQ